MRMKRMPLPGVSERMQAILCERLGSPEELVVGDLPAPAISPGEVRIRVRACGVNFADTLMISGKYQVHPDLPFVPGMEVSGEILEVGGGVTGLAPGRRVLARCGLGGYAGEVCVPAADAMAIPDSMPFDEAAAFAVTYGTAHLGLEHRARLATGETLLVHGASGGVGLAAVQVGKRMGASVIATARGRAKLDVAAAHGADHLIDYNAEDIRARVRTLTGERGADVVFDPVGGDVFDRSVRCIAWEGRIVVVGFASGRIPTLPVNLVLVKNFSVVGLFWGDYARKDRATMNRSLATLLEWYAAGDIRPLVSERYPLRDAARALRTLMERRSTGKVVLVPD